VSCLDGKFRHKPDFKNGFFGLITALTLFVIQLILTNDRRDPLEKIGEAFGIPKDSTVSTILLSVKARLSRDRYLKKYP